MRARRRACLRAASAACLALFAPGPRAQPRPADIRPWNGPVPALDLADSARRVHRLAEYRGRVLFVNFWATWCEPCRDEMPSIERLVERLEGKALSVLAVNLGESEANVKRFLDGAVLHPEKLTVLFDRDLAVARRWGATLLPATYLVDRAGRARYRARGEVDWSAPESMRIVESLLPGS